MNMAELKYCFGPASKDQRRSLLQNVDLEQSRLAALARYEIMDTAAEESFNRFARLAAHGLGMPSALVTFVDGNRQWIKARIGSDLTETRRVDAFCDHTIRSDDVLVVPDAKADPRFAENPMVTGSPNIRFYAGAPIITPDGYRIGCMCAISTEPCQGFDASSRAFLAELAQSVMTELELRWVNRQQAKVSADLAFWNHLSVAIAGAADFNDAVDQILGYCAARTGAAICFLAAHHPSYRMAEYVKWYVAPDSSVADLDLRHWLRWYPEEDLSFGVAMSQGRITDTGPITPADDYSHYPWLQKLIQSGIRRQITYPFDLTGDRFALVFDFENPAIPADTKDLVVELINRLTPLLLGRQREDALERANRVLRTLRLSTEAFARAETAKTLFETACRLAVETGGYDACWIGLAQNDEQKSVNPVASAGQGSAYEVDHLRVSWADQPLGWGPVGTAIREGRISLTLDIASDPRFEPWRNKALASGFRACISVPFGMPADDAMGVLTLYSFNPMAFGQEQQSLLQELATNLTTSLQRITARQERDAAVTDRSISERRVDRLLVASGVVLYSLSLNDKRAAPIEVSHNILDMLGYEPEETFDRKWWREHVHPADLPEASGAIARVLQNGRLTRRYRIRHRDGSYRWIQDEITLQRDPDGNPIGVAGVWIDITDRRAAEEQIYRLVHLDPLTELPNRRLLNERLDAALASARQSGKHGAVLFVDLNQFKTINDKLGHGAGDDVLREAAGRLKRSLRSTDTIARIGGDEFVIMLPEVGDTADNAAIHAGSVARKLLNTLADCPVVVGANEFHLGASIGFTLFPKPADTIETMISEADAAMYQAKAGDADVVMFRPAMQEAILARHALEDEIRSALKTGQFEIWLQDQVDASGTPVAAEALLRLRKSCGRIAGPAEFIGAAESSGLIIPLGRWVLRESCVLLSRIQRDNPDLRIAVNVSPRQFRDSAFLSDVTAALEVSGLPPDRLTLEITENLLIKDFHEIARIMWNLADRGMRFAIDDFGTGYSSLHYLQQLPVHEIKIDKSFISQLPDNAPSAAITEAILAMAQRLNLDVVAEGVETQAQVEFLKARGCSRMQGYFFAHPLPSSAWLAKSRVVTN